jgi:RNA polymerase sigma-70 factor (ECF subfamily)
MEKNQSGEDVSKLTVVTHQEVAIDWSQCLTELAVHRDKSLYIKIYRHFAPKVKAYTIRLGMIDSVAEELMQETMFALWHKVHLYNGTKAAASTWIFTLARNKSIDWMRKQPYPEYHFESANEDLNLIDDIDVAERLIITDRMAKIIAQLPQKQRQVIYMSFYEGRSHAEISARIGVPLGSVKSRIRLASEKIKLIWKDEI